MKETRYVKLAKSLFHTLVHSTRIPLYLHRKSNHVFTVWQHITLLVIRQYENKSYRRFTDWLEETYYLQMFLQLSRIPHYTTLQKFTERIQNSLLEKVLQSFIVLSDIIHAFVGIDATGFKITTCSQYYSEIIDTKQKKRKYTKISIGSDVLKQIICNIKVRRSSKHDNIDFKPIISKIFSIIPISIVVADKGYDIESNHQYVRDHLNAYSLLFHHDMNMYLYGRLMDDIERR